MKAAAIPADQVRAGRDDQRVHEQAVCLLRPFEAGSSAAAKCTITGSIVPGSQLSSIRPRLPASSEISSKANLGIWKSSDSCGCAINAENSPLQIDDSHRIDVVALRQEQSITAEQLMLFEPRKIHRHDKRIFRRYPRRLSDLSMAAGNAGSRDLRVSQRSRHDRRSVIQPKAARDRITKPSSFHAGPGSGGSWCTQYSTIPARQLLAGWSPNRRSSGSIEMRYSGIAIDFVRIRLPRASA